MKVVSVFCGIMITWSVHPMQQKRPIPVIKTQSPAWPINKAIKNPSATPQNSPNNSLEMGMAWQVPHFAVASRSMRGDKEKE